jgi:hypothetical protein
MPSATPAAAASDAASDAASAAASATPAAAASAAAPTVREWANILNIKQLTEIKELTKDLARNPNIKQIVIGTAGNPDKPGGARNSRGKYVLNPDHQASFEEAVFDLVVEEAGVNGEGFGTKLINDIQVNWNPRQENKDGTYLYDYRKVCKVDAGELNQKPLQILAFHGPNMNFLDLKKPNACRSRDMDKHFSQECFDSITRCVRSYFTPFEPFKDYDTQKKKINKLRGIELNTNVLNKAKFEMQGIEKKILTNLKGKPIPLDSDLVKIEAYNKMSEAYTAFFKNLDIDVSVGKVAVVVPRICGHVYAAQYHMQQGYIHPENMELRAVSQYLSDLAFYHAVEVYKKEKGDIFDKMEIYH